MVSFKFYLFALYGMSEGLVDTICRVCTRALEEWGIMGDIHPVRSVVVGFATHGDRLNATLDRYALALNRENVSMNTLFPTLSARRQSDPEGYPRFDVLLMRNRVYIGKAFSHQYKSPSRLDVEIAYYQTGIYIPSGKVYLFSDRGFELEVSVLEFLEE